MMSFCLFRAAPALASAAALVVVAASGCASHRRPPPAEERATEVPSPLDADADPDVPEGIFHTVGPGQTVWRIARAYGVPVAELAESNGIEDPTRIEAGRLLFVPGAPERLRVAPFPAPPPDPADRRPAPATGESGLRFSWPVRGGTVVSGFGDRRRNHTHRGLDISSSRGRTVAASAAGEVVYSGNGLRGYGNTVILDHGGGFRSLYAHNSRLLVRVGDRVDRGAPIAIVGRTGNATGVHCHFEIRRNRIPVDPLLHLSP